MSAPVRCCRKTRRHPAGTQQSNHRSPLFESNLRLLGLILNQCCAEIPQKSFFDSIGHFQTNRRLHRWPAISHLPGVEFVAVAFAERLRALLTAVEPVRKLRRHSRIAGTVMPAGIDPNGMP